MKQSKKSLAKKVSVFTFGLFFFLFTGFTVLAYIYTNQLLTQRERESVSNSLTHLVDRLAATDDALTVDNFLSILENSATAVTYVEDGQNSYILKERKNLTRLLYSNQELAIYDKQKQLIFTTNQDFGDKSVGTLNHIQTYHLDKSVGYRLARKLTSDETGKVIGYVVIFHRLDFYHAMRNRLIIMLLVVEIVGTFLSLLAIFYLTRRFMRPTNMLYDVMTRIRDNPSDLHVRSHIQSGDEIEELSLIFDNMLDQVEDYTQRQSQFISDVSHELRTPVAVIKGHVGMLQRWGKEDPTILDESLEATYHEADRMSIMINDMLNMVRIQGNFDLHRGESTPITKSIGTVLGNFRVLHEDASFTFDNQIGHEVVGAIYKNHFEQALTILIDNAVKYSPNVKQVTVTLEETDKAVRIHIKDRGEGISEDDLKYIFERFYRTDKSRNRQTTQGGLGIGLSILKQIVDAYQLDLTVTSVLDQGTEFIITIPIKE